MVVNKEIWQRMYIVLTQRKSKEKAISSSPHNLKGRRISRDLDPIYADVSMFAQNEVYCDSQIY